MAFENEAEEGRGSTLLGLFDTYVYDESRVMGGQPTWHIRDATLRPHQATTSTACNKVTTPAGLAHPGCLWFDKWIL
jgi:hypothetical protein